MERKYRVRPVKHKHEKRMKATPSGQDPVISRKLSGVMRLPEDILVMADTGYVLKITAVY